MGPRGVKRHSRWDTPSPVAELWSASSPSQGKQPVNGGMTEVEREEAEEAGGGRGRGKRRRKNRRNKAK